MLKKIFFIIDLWRAYSLANSDIEKALFFLNRNSDEAEKYKNKFPDYYILKGSLNFDLENYSEAQKNLELATELLISNEYYSVDEKKYLYIYIYIYLSNILHKNNNSEWSVFDELSKRKNFDINKVRKNLKNNFPHS